MTKEVEGGVFFFAVTAPGKDGVGEVGAVLYAAASGDDEKGRARRGGDRRGDDG